MRGLFLLRRPVCLEGCGLRTLSPILRRHHSSIGVKHFYAPKFDLPGTPCRTRFAPSPTGYLHLGSVRTALYNYLLAKATNGQFILRLEDTDQSRLVPDAEQRLYDDLKWAGLNWDEGPDVGGPYGPYKQSERLPIYDEHVGRLLKEGKAYRCFCAKEQLHEYDKAGFRGPAEQRASNPCIHISPEESEERASKGETYAVIFKSSATPVQVKDMVYREFRNAKPEAEFVIRKQDGFPTYHLANVVDDHLMKVTHVIRGAEWLISTPRHVDLYNAFGWEPPQFAHVGLLVDTERQKLSKRHQGVTMDWYKERKIVPDALLNFAALLGWAPKDRTQSEFMTLEDMVRKFHLKFTKGDIMVTMPKLDFLREKHGAHLVEQEPRDDAKVQEYVTRPLIRAINKFTSHGEVATRENFGLEPDEPLPSMTDLTAAAYDQERRTITDPAYFLQAMRFTKSVAWKPKTFLSDYKWLLWQVPEEVLVRTMREIAKTYKGLTIYMTSYDPVGVLEFIQHRLENIRPGAWTVEDLKAVLKNLDKGVQRNIEAKGKANKDNIYAPLQWALLAGHNGPAVWEQMVFLGREETTRRIKLATEVARKVALETPTPDEAKETEVTESKDEVKVTTEEVKETEEAPKKTEDEVKEN